jgi:UTP--glucose-1-phosphate uridylyltransferase
VLSAVIPVAGLGTRSLPASKVVPKEMLPVFDRPIVQYIVEEAVVSGANDVLFVTSKGKNSIEDHFDSAPELERVLDRLGKTDLLHSLLALARQIEIRTVRQKEQLGLGHAVLMAKNAIANGPFAVMLGDDMIEGSPPGLRQLINFHRDLPGSSDRIGVVMLTEVTEQEVSKYGICEVDSISSMKITRCVEKPKSSEIKSRLAILGRYFLPLDIFSILEEQPRGALGEVQLTDALNTLAKDGRLYGCILKGQRFDAGDRLGFLKANVHHYLRSPLASEVRSFLQEILK